MTFTIVCGCPTERRLRHDPASGDDGSRRGGQREAGQGVQLHPPLPLRDKQGLPGALHGGRRPPPTRTQPTGAFMTSCLIARPDHVILTCCR